MMPADRSELTVTFAHNLVHSAAIALATTLVLTACRGEDPVDSATGSSSSTSGTETGTTTTGTPTTSGTSTSTGVDDPTTTTGDPTTTTDPCQGGGGFIDCTTGDTTTTGFNPLPNGSQCSTDADCISGNCYEIPMFGGVCGECDEDQDCVDAGTGIGCSVSPAGGMCTQGGVGNGCMSDEACMEGLTCGPPINLPLPGLIPEFCNECETSADCDMGMVCNPTFDIMTFAGSKSCVAEGSVANNNLCDLDGDGDLACESGICAPVSVMIIQVGVCGECETDDDCTMGSCTPGMLGQGGVSGSVCN